MHEGLHDPDLLPVSSRELADRPVEDSAQPLAQLISERRVNMAAKASE